ncbi:MAG TPA: hypothetical protein PK239_15060 [Chitinophagales bacterium]|nr:hypothetical protein [Chitinophagales bacterium]
MVQQKDYPIPAMLCFGINSPPAGSNKNAEFIALYPCLKTRESSSL